MNSDIREYARLGLVHHMLYPESMTDPDEHARTLEAFAGRADIETFDCCLPTGAGLPAGDRRRERLIRAIRNCRKEQIAFATHDDSLRTNRHKRLFLAPARQGERNGAARPAELD